jgi:hypothetical protein
MNFRLHNRFDIHDLTHRHHPDHASSTVWRLLLTVLIASNALLLFFLYLYDVI